MGKAITLSKFWFLFALMIAVGFGALGHAIYAYKDEMKRLKDTYAVPPSPESNVPMMVPTSAAEAVPIEAADNDTLKVLLPSTPLEECTISLTKYQTPAQQGGNVYWDSRIESCGPVKKQKN